MSSIYFGDSTLQHSQFGLLYQHDRTLLGRFVHSLHLRYFFCLARITLLTSSHDCPLAHKMPRTKLGYTTRPGRWSRRNRRHGRKRCLGLFEESAGHMDRRKPRLRLNCLRGHGSLAVYGMSRVLTEFPHTLIYLFLNLGRHIDGLDVSRYIQLPENLDLEHLVLGKDRLLA